MAKITVPITITGIDHVKDVVQTIMDEAVFADHVTEDYKKGFYTFGNAVVAILTKMQEDSNG